jgi:hypothetical protein
VDRLVKDLYFIIRKTAPYVIRQNQAKHKKSVERSPFMSCSILGTMPGMEDCNNYKRTYPKLKDSATDYTEGHGF